MGAIRNLGTASAHRTVSLAEAATLCRSAPTQDAGGTMILACNTTESTRIRMPRPKLNAEIIVAAIEGFESQKKRIDTQIGELRAMLSRDSTEGTATLEAPARKRRVSAAARRR